MGMELQMVQLLWAVLGVVAALLSTPAAATVIYVDGGGVSNTTCCPGNLTPPAIPCKTLALGLECAQALSPATPVTLVISEGSYNLPNHSRLTLIEDRSGGFEISGDCLVAGPCVMINCEKGAGLTFINTDGIKLENLSFSGCGVPNNSTSRDFSLGDDPPFQPVWSTLYFLLCRSITISHVAVQETDGTGVVMYSTVGTNTISNSNFSSNVPHTSDGSDYSFSGGGGVYIEFAYCYPGNSSCFSGPSNIPEEFNRDSVYLISDCVFTDNLANVTDTSQFTFILPHKSYHIAFARGGGLSLFFKGSATNNSVTIESSEFFNNTALWGAGLFVEMQDFSSNNSVSVSNSALWGNECLFKESSSQGTGGGGSRIGYVFFGDTHVSGNSVSFQSCNFTGNAAYFGGGVSFYAAREPTESKPTNFLGFVNTTWQENVARAGSGADLSVWHSVADGAVASVNFTDCYFVGNNGSYTTAQSVVVGIGALYLDSIPAYFMGDSLFVGNTHSALAAVTTGIYITANSSVGFFNNKGRHGGAVALLGEAFIQTSPSSGLVFVNNSAVIAGGAIYQNSIGDHDLINSRNCFIRYCDITVTPDQWNSSFFFSGNHADGRRESIFASSLLICQWGGAFGNSSDDLSRVFCWSDAWNYDGGNCTTEVRTSPAEFESSSDFKIDTFPGERRTMHLKMLDDRGSDVTSSSVFHAKSFSKDIEIDSGSHYISDDHIEVHTNGSRDGVEVNGSVLLETIDPRVVQVVMNITVFPCPPGMVLVGGSDSSSCQCEGNFKGILECNATSYRTRLQRGNWIGLYTFRGETKIVASSTPYYDSSSDELFIKLPRKTKELDNFLCGRVNRRGTLCGKCLEGFGPAIHAQKCIRCDADYMWALYLISQYLPLTLLFVLVVVLDIRVTSAPANAFIFFSQVLPVAFTLNGGGAIATSHTGEQFVKVYSFFYNIWNLQFFKREICLSQRLSSLEAISTNYIEAAYPLLLIGLMSVFIWMYERGFRCIVCICRPFHVLLARFQRRWNIRRSLIHAFASFILLSYSRFILVSFLLLTTTPLLKENGKALGPTVVFYDGTIPYLSRRHIPFFALSLLVLMSFVLITPLLLVVPSLARNLSIIRSRWPACGRFLPRFDRCSIKHWPKLDAFLEAFHGCYRDGTNSSRRSVDFDYRWFAGFYLVLRVAVFAVYAFTDLFLHYVFLQLFCTAALLAFMVLRPYKDNFYNNFDASMFTLLMGINTLTMYNYGRTVVGSHPSVVAFGFQYILVLLPLIYISVVVLRHLCRYCSRGARSGRSAVSDTEREGLIVGRHDNDDREGPMTRSGSHDYLSFMRETGRMDEVNVYRPASTTYGSENSEEKSLPSTEVDSGNCRTQSTISPPPTTSLASDDYRQLEGRRTHEFESLPPGEDHVRGGPPGRVWAAGGRLSGNDRGSEGEGVNYGSVQIAHGGDGANGVTSKRLRNTLT